MLNLRQRWQRQPGWVVLGAAAAVLIIVLVVVVVIRNWGAGSGDDYAVVRAQSTSDFRDYWWTARALRESGQLTDAYGVHNYLPFFPIFMLPWSVLPLPLAAGAFMLLSLLLLAAGVILVELLLNQEWAARPRAALLATIGLLAAYVVSGAVLGAVDVLLVFLILITWVLFEQRQEWAAGVALGLAILIKVVPGVLVIFFLLKRRWRPAAGAGAAVLVGGLLFPLATLGWEQTQARYHDFFSTAVQGHSARATIMAEAPQKAKYSNNSLPIVLRRLLTATNADPHADGRELYVNIVDLPRPVVWWIYCGLTAALLAATVMRTLPGARRWPPEETAEITQIRAQFGLWCCLMILAAPLVWTRYLLLAWWPLALAADRAQRNAPRRNREHYVGVVALLVWLLGVAALAVPAARAVGAQLVSVLVLWVAVWLIARPPAPPQRQPKWRVVGPDEDRA